MNGQYGQIWWQVWCHFTGSPSPPSLLEDGANRKPNTTALLCCEKTARLRKCLISDLLLLYSISISHTLVSSFLVL